MTSRIDVHQHAIPDFYRAALVDVDIDAAGGRDLPARSTEQLQAQTAALDIATAVLSISTSGVGSRAGSRSGVDPRTATERPRCRGGGERPVPIEEQPALL